MNTVDDAAGGRRAAAILFILASAHYFAISILISFTRYTVSRDFPEYCLLGVMMLGVIFAFYCF